MYGKRAYLCVRRYVQARPRAARPRARNYALSLFSELFSICACHPCAGAMLIFSVSFQC